MFCFVLSFSVRKKAFFSFVVILEIRERPKTFYLLLVFWEERLLLQRFELAGLRMFSSLT